MYSEIIFISKIVDYYRVLENKDCGFGPRKIDLKDPGFLLFTNSSGYEGYALTECHSGWELLNLAVFPWPRECGRCPIQVQESRARSRTTRSTLIWEIPALLRI